MNNFAKFQLYIPYSSFLGVDFFFFFFFANLTFHLPWQTVKLGGLD